MTPPDSHILENLKPFIYIYKGLQVLEDMRIRGSHPFTCSFSIYVKTFLKHSIYIYIEKEQVNGFETKSFHLKPMEETHQHKKTNLYD